MTSLGISHLLCQDKHWKKALALDTIVVVALATIAGLGITGVIPMSVSYPFIGLASFIALADICIAVKKYRDSNKKKLISPQNTHHNTKQTETAKAPPAQNQVNYDSEKVRLIAERIKSRNPSIEDSKAHEEAISLYHRFDSLLHCDSWREDLFFFFNFIQPSQNYDVIFDLEHAEVATKAFYDMIKGNPLAKASLRNFTVKLIQLAQAVDRWGYSLPLFEQAFSMELSIENHFQKMITEKGESESKVAIKRNIHQKLIDPKERIFPNLAIKHVQEVYEIYDRMLAKYPEIDVNEACDRAILIFKEARNKRINTSMGRNEALQYVEKEMQERVISYMNNENCSFSQAFAIAAELERMRTGVADIPESGFSEY
jgi:hypothetical protein